MPLLLVFTLNKFFGEKNRISGVFLQFNSESLSGYE
jgi:hypothetical protein